jgi:hypothetical protein
MVGQSSGPQIVLQHCFTIRARTELIETIRLVPRNDQPPMSYAEHWVALAAQIKSLQKAGELYSRFQGYHQEDSYGAGQYLLEQCGASVQSLELFRRHFAGTLPPEATKRIDYFLGTTLARAAKDLQRLNAARGEHW